MTPDTKRRRAPVIPFPEPEEEPELTVARAVLDAIRLTSALAQNTDTRLCLLETKVQALMMAADRSRGTQGVR